MKTNAQIEIPEKIVVIGASAGGLKAIQQLFDHLDHDTDHAFVIVQHLSKDHKSLMPEILTKNTLMPIIEAFNDLPILPNHVYLYPSDQFLSIKENRFKNSTKKRDEKITYSIDFVLRSVAKDRKDAAVGIILSGSGNDGSKGLKAIQAKGGSTLVQLPTSAEFESMPSHAIATGAVDHVLSPTDIGNFLSHKSTIGLEKFSDQNGEFTPHYQQVLTLLDKHVGIDFRKYKQTTLLRRLDKRIHLHNLTSITDYIKILKKKPAEQNELMESFLIGVTQFFRDPEAHQALIRDVFPRLCASHLSDKPIRIWIAGCSTGEEAYSIAMALDDFIQSRFLELDFKIFATDINKKSLGQASSGRYQLDRTTGIPDRYLEKYFESTGSHYVISKRIKDRINFTYNDLLKSPPFIRMDLIVCRNVLIYLEPRAQEQILNNFLFSFNPNGLLFLGNSENLGKRTKDFEVLDKKWRLFLTAKAKYRYKKVENISTFKPMKTPAFSSSTRQPAVEDSETPYYKFLSDHYSPSLLFIDEAFNIRFIKGDIGQRLNHKEGVFHQNILKLVNPEMAKVIKTGIRQAARQRKEVRAKRIPSQSLKGKTTFVDLVFSKAEIEEMKDPLYVIRFGEEHTTPPETASITLPTGEDPSARVEELEQELELKQAELNQLREQIESSNEELQSANEELLANNEELQTTNEELQSINEEHHTVNNELEEKNRELQQVYDDLNHMYDTQDIATLFIDKELCVRSFTPAIKEHFKLKNSDLGRPITNFMFFDQETRTSFFEDVATCFEDGKRFEKLIISNGEHHQMKILPFKSKRKIEGVVITLVNVNELTLAKNEYANLFDNLNSFFAKLRLIRNKKGDPIDFEFALINEEFERFLGVPSHKILGVRLSKAFPVFKEDSDWFERFVRTAATGEKQQFVKYAEGLNIHVNCSLFSPGEDEIGLTMIDVTENVNAQQLIEKSRRSYQNLFENINAMYEHFRIILDKKGKPKDMVFVDVNSKAAEFYGTPVHELVGTSLNDSLNISAGEFQQYMEESYQVTKTKIPFSSSSFTEHTGQHWLSEIYSPDELEVIYVSIDITDQIQNKQELELSNTQLKMSLSIDQLAVWEWQVMEDKIVNYNTFWESIYEMEPTEIGPQYTERLFADDVEESWRVITEGMATDEPYSHVFRLWNREKTKVKWISNTGKVIQRNEKGEPTRVLGISKDITKKKEQEVQLHKTAEDLAIAQSLAKVAYWHFDLVKDEVTWTKELFEMYGFDPSLPPPPFEEQSKIFTKESWQRLTQAVQLAVTQGIPYDMELEMAKDKAPIGWMRAIGEVIKDKEGNVISLQGVAQDISESKEINLQLEKTAEDLAIAQSLAKVAYWHFDLVKNEVMWTKELYEMYGFDPTLPPPPFEEQSKIFTEESWNRLTNAVQLATTEGIPYDMELEMAKDKAPIGWMRAIGEVIKDKEGNVISLQGVAQDISESKEINLQLERQNKFAEAVTESSAAGIYIFDVQKNQNIYANKESGEILGYSPEELKSMPSEDFVARFHPDDLPTVFAHIEEIITTKKAKKITYRFKRKNGRYVTCLSVDSPFEVDQEGNLVSYLGSFIDITELQQKEEELLAAKDEAEAAKEEVLTANSHLNLSLDSEKAAIWEWDILNDITINYNKHWKDLFEFENTISISEEFNKRVHPDDMDMIWAAMSDHIENKTERYTATYRYYNRDLTSYKWIRNSGKVIERDEKGRASRLMGFAIDVTDLQEIKSQLIEARDMAEGANKQKDLFLANMSHEIRTPMNAVVGFAKLLKRENLSNEKKEEYIHMIDSNSSQLMKIIDDILQVNKIESGQIQFKKQLVTVNSFLCDLSKTNSIQAEEKGLALIVNLDKQLKGCSIEVDETRFSQVINNLITNAIKYTKKGSIEVGTQRIDGQVKIYVKDQGKGIKKADQDRVFDRFSQANTELNSQEGGIGLGLPISKSLTEAMGGSIHLESKYNQGSNFHVLFPISSCEEIVIEEEVAVPVHTNGLDKSKTKSVVIADDNKSVRYYYREILDGLPIDLKIFENGKQVVDYIKKHPDTDLVLLDIRMPVMDGLEALERIKDINPNLSVVAQSAFAMDEQIEEFKAKGFEGYYTKPLDEDLIVDLVNQVAHQGEKV